MAFIGLSSIQQQCSKGLRKLEEQTRYGAVK